MPGEKLSSAVISERKEGKPLEACGVFGAWTPGEPAKNSVRRGIRAVNHRGQDGVRILSFEPRVKYDPGANGRPNSAGRTTPDSSEVRIHVNSGLVSTGRFKITGSGRPGLVNEAFPSDNHNLSGISNDEFAIAHVRYATHDTENALSDDTFGPNIHTSQKTGITVGIAHNGQLTNAEDIKQKLGREFPTDSAVIPALVIHHAENVSAVSWSEYLKTLDKESDYSLLEYSVREAVKQLEGSFSLVIMGTDMTGDHVEPAGSAAPALSKKLIAFRDHNGRKPLVYGDLSGGGVAFGSETGAMHAVEAIRSRSVIPGEMIVVSPDGTIKSEQLLESDHQFCVFELAYLSKESHFEDGIGLTSVKRYKLGRQLARENAVIAQRADIIVGVPKTGVTFGNAFAHEAGALNRYKQIIQINPEAGRTFITDGQNREQAVSDKYIVDDSVQGVVAVIEDTIVRGATVKNLTKKLFKAGASEVHFLSGLPRVEHDCDYGVDINQEELVAPGKTDQQVAAAVGASSVRYLSLSGMEKALETGNLCKECLIGKARRMPKAAKRIVELAVA